MDAGKLMGELIPTIRRCMQPFRLLSGVSNRNREYLSIVQSKTL